MSTDLTLATATQMYRDGRCVVWAQPTVLDAFGVPWWWSAALVVVLPEGMTLVGARAQADPIEVTVLADVDTLASGLNEVNERYEQAPDPARRPAQILLAPADLLRPVRSRDLDEFRTQRDYHRLDHDLPRCVLRSDRYGQQPLHVLRHPWPAGIFMQGGAAHRTVAGERGAFIEAFPRDPRTMLRGEGDTFADAEDAMWARWQQHLACPGHEYETRGYRNGVGVCKHCGLFTSGAFDLAEIGSVCVVCGVGTYWSTVTRRDEHGHLDRKADRDLVCEEHALPSYIKVTEEIWAHQEDGAPAPDISWFAGHLPANIPLADVSADALHDAIEHGRRDLLDAMIAERGAGQ